MTQDMQEDEGHFSSQEEPTEVQEGMRVIPTSFIPAVCLGCKEKFFTNDLTVCPLCSSSSVAKASIIHYAMDCSEDAHDKRYQATKKKNDYFSTVFFVVACQKDVSTDKPKPSNLTSEIRYVTCASCLREADVKIDNQGRAIV